jgi:NADH dehydrogenase/NADH:ubiquinone oxidoreductase subunit G
MGDKDHPAVIAARNVRRQIDGLLDEYMDLAERMSELENAFMTYVLLPGYQLQLAVKKREFLEAEYARIANAIQRKAYASTEEIVQDVRQAISQAEVEFSGRELADKDTDAAARSPVAGLDPGDQDLDLTEEQKAAITGEFKRSVILKVHADTSDAPYEEFHSVLEAYKKKDFLLMKAFIIRYAGEFVRDEKEPEKDFVQRVVRSTSGDREVLEKLTARIDGLRQNMSAKELESQDEVLRQIKSQSREIQKAIYREAEELLRLESRLEALIKTTFTVH